MYASLAYLPRCNFKNIQFRKKMHSIETAYAHREGVLLYMYTEN